MRFVHLSSKPYTRFVSPTDLGTSFKPAGTLWVACDTEWKDWLKQSELPLPKYEYEVVLKEDRLMTLKTEAEIKSFSERFSIPDKEFPHFEVDWNRVKAETGKDGIYIPNAAIESAREKYAWYASFDICSAAVWNEAAIASITKTKGGKRKPRRRTRRVSA
jgi:hypothetical protein